MGTAATLSGDQVFDEGTLTIENRERSRSVLAPPLPGGLTLDVRGDYRDFR